MTQVLPKETILWLLKSTFCTILTLFFIQNSKAQTNSAATGSISGMVWVDENENTYKEDTEVGMGGVTIDLYEGFSVVKTVVTAPDGSYAFNNLSKGVYRIKALSASLPTQYEIVPYSNILVYDLNVTFDENKDSDVNPMTGVSVGYNIDTESLSNNNFKIDVGVYKKYETIEGLVWNDTNENGILDEEIIPETDVEVILYDENLNGLDTAYTDTNGKYKLKIISKGLYYVVFSTIYNKNYIDENNEISTSVYKRLNLNKYPPYSSSIVYNIGVVPDTLGIIGGLVWEDTNENGLRDVGEKPVKNVSIYAINEKSEIVANELTNKYGRYNFSRLPDGEYILLINCPKEYLISPITTGVNSIASSFDPVTFMTLNSTIINNSNIQEKNIFVINAGIYKPANYGSISGKIWTDTNEDGLYSVNEPALNNVTIYLNNQYTNLLASTKTDYEGNYMFSGLASGNYLISVLTPFGKTYTRVFDYTNPSDSYIYTDPNNIYFGRTIIGSNIDTSKPVGDPSRDIKNFNAGLIPNQNNASFGGYVYQDQNENNVKESTEGYLPGVKVQLFTTLFSRDLIATTFSDLNGVYKFDNVTEGIYNIRFSSPFPCQNCKIDSTFEIRLNVTSDINNSIIDNLSINQGFIKKLGLISGRVALLNGTFNDLKTYNSVPKFKVYLLDLAFNKLDSTITGPYGEYIFKNLPNGKYLVKVDIPQGFKATNQYVGGFFDSSQTDSTGTTFIIEVDNSTVYNDFKREIQNIDTRLVIWTGQIGLYVWDDINGNGLQETNEPPLSEVPVDLYISDSLLTSSVTDTTGKVIFDQVTSGTYNLKIHTPSGYMPTIPFVGENKNLDSDLNNENPYVFDIVVSPTSTLNKDFSLAAGFTIDNTKGSLGDYVWLDANNNGLQDQNENGVGDIIIELYLDGNLLAKDTTDASGAFGFANLESGTYKIKLVSTSIPKNLQVSTLVKQGNNIGTDSDLYPGSLDTEPIVIDLSNTSQKSFTDIDIAFSAKCENVICVPISIKKILSP
ncbi:SdrD B-like domain-containing protein [Lacihabitans lacunae]|uniref:SdrD B-like domain-containing protein n=1 Tax=Lacihabitans lacunae TaxID=1028214 RepID=A0ABV7Z117_9BACT